MKKIEINRDELVNLALDLCNTRSWRLDPARSVDRLATPQDLVAWFAAVAESTGPGSAGPGSTGPGSTGPGSAWPDLREQVEAQPDRGAQALDQVRALRDATISVIDAHLRSVAPDPADVDQLAAAWRTALAVATLPTRLPWRWTITPTDVEDLGSLLALAVADLLHRQDLSGLRRCDGEGCGWLFLDTTRNHSRRWCDPLDCGNRARVRSYTKRHRHPQTP